MDDNQPDLRLQSWAETPWWHKAIITGIVAGCFPIVWNLFSGQIWVGHNFKLVLFVLFPTWSLLAVAVAVPIFWWTDRRRAEDAEYHNEDADGSASDLPRGTTLGATSNRPSKRAWKYCPDCGKPFSGVDRFCSGCGLPRS